MTLKFMKTILKLLCKAFPDKCKVILRDLKDTEQDKPSVLHPQGAVPS